MHTIRLYCDVAHLRSFSQAAAKHGVTQSAASQRIGQLEKRLGVVLLDRSVRPLALTPAGEEFHRGCQELVERYDRLERRVARLRPEPAGEVRVDAIYSAGIDLLNQIKERFEEAYPKVRVQVEYKQPEQVHQAVLNGWCDLGILSYPRRWRGVGLIPLRNERMAVVTAPGHPLAQCQRVFAGVLDDWPMIGFEPDMPAARSIGRYLRQHNVAVNVTAAFDNVDTIKHAVAVTDDHLAILPKRTVMREVKSGTLAVVDLEPELLRPLGVVFRKPGRVGAGRVFDPAAQAFVDYLLEHAGPHVDLAVEAQAGASPLMGVKA